MIIEEDAPLVSILIPYYNDELFLEESIKSVLSQNYQNFQLILYNHDSQDNSYAIAHSFHDNRIIHIDATKNLGSGSGIILKRFLQDATGKYVKLFCADDIMLPNCLEILVDYMECNPYKDFACGDMVYIDSRGNDLHATWFRDREGFNLGNDEIDEIDTFFWGIGHLPFPAFIIKRFILDTIEIEKIFIMLYDMTIWTRLLIKGYKIGFINMPIVQYRIHKNQQSFFSPSKEKEIRNCADFEGMLFCKLFFEIKEIDVVKRLCRSDVFVESLTERDVEFIPFIIAHNYLFSPVPQYRLYGHLKMYDLLDNDMMRKKIEQRFGYGIKDFRSSYRTSSVLRIEEALEHKQITVGRVLYLALRKIYHILRNKYHGITDPAINK